MTDFWPDRKAAIAAARDRLILEKLEAAFWHVDDVVCATAPDTPPAIQAVWDKLAPLMTPEFMRRRDRLRDLVSPPLRLNKDSER